MNLKYKAELTGCESTISQNYSGKELDLYRWVHNPIVSEDYEVQAKNPLNVPSIDIDTASEDEKLTRIGKYALSCFLTEKDAAEVYLTQKEKRISKNPAAGERFEKQKGGHIQKIHVTKNDGLCSEPNEVNHVNFLEYDTTDMNSLTIGVPTKIS